MECELFTGTEDGRVECSPLLGDVQVHCGTLGSRTRKKKKNETSWGEDGLEIH